MNNSHISVRFVLAWLLMSGSFALCASCDNGDDLQIPDTKPDTRPPQTTRNDRAFPRETPFVVRQAGFEFDNRWQGNGISYGPYREGQRPGGDEPTKEQIREDLHLLADDGWQMIRMYGTEPFARTACEVIREDGLPLKVMVGAWIATEENNPEQQLSNRGQIERAISIANDFENIVFAVSVGNESQVSWSFHKVNPQRLVQYVREVRSKVKVPVTVADDFMYWISDDSKSLAEEIDFIVTHVYAMWHGQSLENAMQFTKENFELVKKQHPSKPVVLGEGGWATEKAASGDEAERIKGVAGEREQKEFFTAYTRWLKSEQIPYFYFEAFDEPWKGGPDPAAAEKHWGLFRVDRTPKPAVAGS